MPERVRLGKDMRRLLFVMSALRGRGWVGQNMPIVLIKCVNGTVTRGGGVVKNLNSFADVINGSLLMGKIV